jgi:hypothetical protein
MTLQEELRVTFDYDKELGRLRWREQRKGIPAGMIAGTSLMNKYRRVMFNYKFYQEHRLIFAWHYGYYPENVVDHIDRDPSNNKIENLREASHSCNIRNTGNPCNNTSGVKGVSWDSTKNAYSATIRLNNSSVRKTFFLGRYKDFDDAVAARLAAEQCLGWGGCDSSSPAYLYLMGKLNRL